MWPLLGVMADSKCGQTKQLNALTGRRNATAGSFRFKLFRSEGASGNGGGAVC